MDKVRWVREHILSSTSWFGGGCVMGVPLLLQLLFFNPSAHG